MRVRTYRSIGLMLLAIAALVAIGRGAEQPTQSSRPVGQADDRQIASLIRKLDANEYETREAASDELLKIGEPAVPAIKAAIGNSASLEVKVRAERLVRQIIVWGDMPHELSLKRLMRTVKVIRGAKDRERACRDENLDRLLDCWVRVLGQASGQPECQPPVRCSDFKIAANAPSGDDYDSADGALLIANRVRVGVANRCIVLADGPIEIDSADDCIIVTRSIAKVDRCHNSAIFAGFLVDSLFADRSILVAGGETRIESANNVIVAGGRDVGINASRNLTIINPPEGRADWRDNKSNGGARELQLREMRLIETVAKNPLSGRTQLLETLWQGDAVARLRFDNGKEKIIRCGQNVCGPDGKPAAGLEHWTLLFANRGLAVFTSGEDFAALRVRH
ncbi:MAG TPA: hypothetical protein VKB78_13570 [Pirellulales bacterium]|nr:hypothetical protein [Pirellulales bacterium]